MLLLPCCRQHRPGQKDCKNYEWWRHFFFDNRRKSRVRHPSWWRAWLGLLHSVVTRSTILSIIIPKSSARASFPAEGTAQHGADWAVLTSSLSRSKKGLVMLVRPRCSSRMLSNSSSISRKTIRGSWNLACRWKSFLHFFFRIFSPSSNGLMFGHFFQTIRTGLALYSTRGTLSFSRFSTRGVQNTIIYKVNFLLLCTWGFTNFLMLGQASINLSKIRDGYIKWKAQVNVHDTLKSAAHMISATFPWETSSIRPASLLKTKTRVSNIAFRTICRKIVT